MPGLHSNKENMPDTRHSSARPAELAKKYADTAKKYWNERRKSKRIRTSDDHGCDNPCGFAGTGVTGAGVGHNILTRDVPVPVWAGDGSVT